MRIDKWLWAARFFKTRSLATEEVARGRFLVNGQMAKPSRDLKPGDTVAWSYVAFNVNWTRTITVLGLAATRGSASVAQTLYSEATESIQARDKAYAERQLHSEPAHAIVGGRPSKRDRRELDAMNTSDMHHWNDRWSASLDG